MKYTATILAVAALLSPAIFAHNISTVDDLTKEITEGINAYFNSAAFKTTDFKMTSTLVTGGNATLAATEIAALADPADIETAILAAHCTNNSATPPVCVPATSLADVYNWKAAPSCKNISTNLFDSKAYGPVTVNVNVDNAVPAAGSTAAIPATHAFNGSVVVPIEIVAKKILTNLVQTLNLNDFVNDSVSNNASAAWCSCARQSYYFSNYSNAKNASELFKGKEDPTVVLVAGTQEYFVDVVQRKCFAFVAVAAQPGDARALIASAVASTVATVAVVASFL